MSAVAWMSNADINFEISYSLKSDAYLADIRSSDMVSRSYSRAEVVPSELLPKEFYPVYERVKLNALPPIFNSLGYWFVRQDCAMLNLLDNVMDTYVTASRAFAVRMALQGGANDNFSRLVIVA